MASFRYRFIGFEAREEMVKTLAVKMGRPVARANAALAPSRAVCRALCKEDKAAAYRMYAGILDDLIASLRQQLDEGAASPA